MREATRKNSNSNHAFWFVETRAKLAWIPTAAIGASGDDIVHLQRLDEGLRFFRFV